MISKLIIACLFMVVTALPGYAQLIFSEDFEGADPIANFREQGGCYPHSFNVVTDPCSETGPGNQVVRVTNIMGSDNSVCPDSPWNNLHGSPPNQWYKHRSELMPDPSNTRIDYNVDYWIGLKTFADDSYPTNTPLIYFNVTQIIPDPFEGPDMPLRVETDGRWRHRSRNNSGLPDTYHNVHMGQLQRGRWIHWVIHYKRHTSNGRAEVWKDDVKLVDYSGRTSQSTADDAQWKFGLYHGPAVDSSRDGETYIMYFDNVKLASGANEFATVDPSP